MTNKEELREQLKTKFSALELIYRDTERTTLLDLLVDFFWNEIEQIRKADMERVEEKIKYMQGYITKIPKIDSSMGELCDADVGFVGHIDGQVVFKNDVLSIIKQDEN